MKLILYCLFYSLSTLLHYYVIGQEPDPHPGQAAGSPPKENDGSQTTSGILPRHVIENNFKPAIFGSYKFNPINQQFNVSDEHKQFTRPTAPKDEASENQQTTTLATSPEGKGPNRALRNALSGERVTNLRSKPQHGKKMTIPWAGAPRAE